MSKLAGAILALGLGAAWASPATASDFDGSRTLLCAPTDVFSCDGADECERVTVEEANLPHFVTVDFKNKQLSGTTPDGVSSTSAIENVRKLEGRTILQGSENGRGWSVVLQHATGNMAAAVADEDAGFMLFGACTIKQSG